MSDNSQWPESLSDGLTIPCSHCGEIPRFDYIVDDSIWATLVPKENRTGVVCLPCLDALASRRGIRIASHVRKIEFTGTGATVRCEPTLVHEYDRAAGMQR